MLFSFKNLRTLIRKNKLFLAFCLFSGIAPLLVINLTRARTYLYDELKTPKEATSSVSAYDDDSSENEVHALKKVMPDLQNSAAEIESQKSSDKSNSKNPDLNVWCEAFAYKDLSQDPRITRFSKWLNEFQKFDCILGSIDCTDHDPRYIYRLLDEGEKLAVARKPVFSQILRGNPRQALELAIPQNLLSVLPRRIREHLEQWESGFADIRSMHLCFTEEHPGGYIKTTAQFPDGRNFRTWSFGNRSKLQHKKGLAIWGISLGEDLAISEDPFRITNNADSTGIIDFAGSTISFSSETQRELVIHEIRKAETHYRGRRGAIYQIKYPVALASSMSADSLLRAKYDLNTTKVTFNEALSVAMSKNGNLLQISDETENRLISKWLKEQNENSILFPGFDESNNSVNYVWLGATDNNSTKGLVYNEETNSTTQELEINASEGDWKWLNGEEFSFENWAWDTSSNATKDFAALDWNDTNGSWVDINETARLPFIIEYDLDIAKIETDLKGIRKVLVVPARFVDETVYYKSHFGGSNVLLTNEFDEEVMEQIKADPYEPATRATIQKAMDEVAEFYNRNTDGELKIIPVISPVVTLPHMGGQVRRYMSLADGSAGSNAYDSDGNYTRLEQMVIQELPFDPDKPSIEALAMGEAASAGEDWDYEGFSFVGLSSIDIIGNSIDTNFSEPPSVALVGGEVTTASGVPHPRFEPASVEVNLDSNGDVIGAIIVEPGEYYGSAPNILLDGIDYSDHFEIVVEHLLISKVALTNYSAGAPGLGWVGAPGAHVQITDGQLSSGIIAHEIGHNFGLWHANRFVSRSESVLSDDSDIIEYGNPYSVMGGDKDIVNGGDLTALEKVAMNNFFDGGGGYTIGSGLGADVVDLRDSTAITNSIFNEFNRSASNLFRIYRSDYKAPPRFLRESDFSVVLPQLEYDYLDKLNLAPFEVRFVGTGEEANGSLSLVTNGNANALLQITNGGRGFVEEPTIEVVGENDEVILTLNPSWIRIANGSDFDQQAQLVSFSEVNRWIRGARIKTPANIPSVRPLNINADGLYSFPLTDYYVSYRTGVSEDGLVLEVTNNYEENEDGVMESFMLDATPETPLNFQDAHLLLGTTYSDYDADIHITPIRNGGNDPMKYIECVINIGTIGGGEARAPKFDISLSDSNPKPKEFVEISATVTDGNSGQYAYSWYLNEKPLTSPIYLNQPAINYQFSDAGRYVIRLVVSDLKGAVASRNVVITVKGDELTNRSMLSGTVGSSQGFIQGARVILDRSPVIEHNVSLSGSLYDSFFVDGMNNPAQFVIDGQIAPQLVFRRGEIHRFNFEKSVHGITMSFLEQPENTAPRVHINMLSDPKADSDLGNAYFRNPKITYKFNSAFSNYLTENVATYYEMLNFLSEQNNSEAQFKDGTITSKDLLEFLDSQNFTDFGDSSHLVTRPYARALMQETSIYKGAVGPSIYGEAGYVTYGGRGYSLNNIPIVEVRRASIWEDYNKSEANATAKVDGVNTISPVIAEEFLGNTWETRPEDLIIPDLVVWGSGGGDEDDPLSEVNASVDAWVSSAGSYMRTINILNQGKGFEPNSTMAVLHYPTEPLAYWTFDRHETLFEDKREGRYQPSPAWNREIKVKDGFRYYWTFDDNDSGITDSLGKSLRLESNETLEEEDFDSWGLLGKSLHLADAEINATNFVNSMDQNFTVSFWVKPEGDFDINFSSDVVHASYSNGEFGLQEPTPTSSALIPRFTGHWTHIAFVYNGTNISFYVNGDSQVGSTTGSPTFDSNDPVSMSITSQSGRILLDEFRVFNKSLSETSIRYLAGISFLDISGNKFHATPIGSFLTAPDVNMSSSDVPENITAYSFGSGTLGDSFDGEDNGKSLSLSGSEQFLDLENHLGNDFKLTEGTISVWVKQNAQSSSPTAPIFSMVRPYKTVDNNGTNELSESGKIFSLELQRGSPRLAGFSANQSLRDGEWSHLVATFPFVQFWINGQQVDAQVITSGNAQFEEASELTDLANNAKYFRVGYSYDRIALSEQDQLPATPPEAYFHGHLDDLAIYDRILTQQEVTYLYNLWMGKEQIPRLEAVVDAVGTVVINEGGEGYRENPDLDFWYGEIKEKEDLETFPDLETLKSQYNLDPTDDINGTHGQLAYVEEDESVYSLHIAKENNRTYAWRENEGIVEPNGWRKFISAAGLGEFENASLGHVVWAKRMDELVDVAMPDGRFRTQRLVDYVTMDQNNSSSLERNASSTGVNEFYKPNGLYGFVERVDLLVDGPSEYNSDAVDVVDTAHAYVHFYIDNDANESITLVDPGTGVSDIPFDNIKISGPGYQPATDTQKEEEHPGFAEIETDQTMAGTIYAGSGISIYNWSGNEDVNVSRIDFNKTYLSVSVDNPGFGYAMPVDFEVIGGRPTRIDGFFTTPLPEYNSSVEYDFEEAEFEVTSVSADGAIESISITNMGRGYVNYDDLTDEELETLAVVLRAKGYDFSTYPFISITGGGGHGALFKANIDSNGSITSTTKIDGGRGYENVIPNNYPRAVHTPTLSAGEKNASLAVMLGGYLKEIPRCTLCEAGAPEGHDIATTPSPYSHLEPWIEIWDRGRSEEEIDSMGARAHAAPKVVNGEIVKVIVTNSGTGYIDPVVMVRDAPPKHIAYHTTGGNFNRTWKCTYERTLPTGEKLQCGHVHVGHYPPEYCPGETDDTLPYEDENGSLIYATGSDLVAWKARHDDLHKSCTESDAHLSVGFLSRKCWGTKTNYILHDNAIYRNPRADWLELDANLTIISKNGKIREIVVDNPGSNYYATQIHVEGTGSGVDAIPVFNEYGLNTRVIFDDPRIKNLEMDLVPRPHGAGQGFRERPWAGDEIKNAHYKSRISGSPYGTEINNPLVGYDDRVDVIAIHSDDYKSTWNFGQPVMADYLGDRVLQVEVMDPGLYENSTELNVTLDYDASGSLDKNRDGSSDFIAANITGFATTRVTKFVLDDNASYEDNSSDLALERGLFTENPRIQILDGRNFQMGLDKKLSYSTENPFSNIRFNDSISYDPNPDKSYIELYIDDRFPTQLYYGEGITTGDNSMVVPAFGGQILVTEGVPGGSWAIEEPMEKPNFSLSDENGYYAFTNLSYGMYNVSVLLEDQKLQESTFRPVDNETRISQFVYLPGFPDLTLVTDNYGKGQSTLLWSRESRNLSRSSTGPLDKVLAGVGRGFDPSKTPPELIIIPDDENFITTRPNIEVSVLVDGSLRIEIVDDENTTQYFPSDKFTIKYSSTVTGIDFLESYLYSESNQTFKSGTLSSWEYNETMTGTSRYQSAPRLIISPDDGDGANILEAVLSTSAIGEVANVFRAQVFEGNGTEINASNVEWKVSLDFNSSEGEGNNTNIVQLEGPSGTRDLNTTGDQIQLYLHSRLREYSGSLHGIEVVQGGKGYRLFEPVVITDSNGYGLEANIEQIVTETFYVSGVQPGPTFYKFTDSNNQDRNFSDIEFIPGHTYKFVADDINTSHPFMIGESIGDMDSSLVSGSSLVGDMGEIIVSFPSNHAGELAYFSEGNHSMTESVDVNVTETFTVSGGGTSEPFFTITDSDGNNNNLSSIKLSAGKTYKFEADDINTSHPFMIGERTGDMDSLIVSGGPITGSNGEIIVAIPDGYQGELFYFSANDSTLTKTFDINETDVRTLGEISKVAVSNRGYGYTHPMEIRVSGSGGNGALFEPILPQGYLVLEANFTMTNGQVLSEQVKIKASDRQVLSSQEKWMDLYLDSFLDRNDSWWERELSASNIFEDIDDDNLTNFEEWRFGSNPLSIDTDLDDLNDSTEYSFTSSPILADTDNDGLTDYKEWSWPHQNLDERPDPRNPDSDGDGLLDGEDELPKNSDGMGILSGRIIVQKRYSAVKNKLFYRFAEANETSDWNDTSHWLSYDDENWTGGPNFFYEDNLFHDRNYTIQVYIELKDLNESDDANFTLGEPIASETVTLNSNLYGIQLVPVDDPPQLVKNKDFENTLSIDLNETNETAAYDWGLTATDPYTPNDSYDMGSTPSNSVKIILEGNFTEYLIGLPENNYEYNSTMLVDLDLVPPGIYSLTYKALDNFENYSGPVEQKIIVTDTQPPFLTIIDFVNNTGITTERRDSFSDVYPDYNETIFTFLDQNNATADLNWSIGIPFNINDLFVEARDNKSGAVTWELSYDESLHTNALNSYELNFTTRDDSNNLSTLTLNLNIIDEQVPEVFITGSSIDSNNSLNAYRGKGFYLEDKVQIFADDSFQGYQADLLNFDQNRSSFQVDWDGLSVEIVDNKTFVLPGFDSNYTITFSYSDSSGNMDSASLVLRMEDPPWEISGKAIDGYLKGSLVRFIKNGDGPVAISDEEGNFTLIFSEEELQRFDLDANGIISSDEGTIVVSGGIDVDTNASFLGELRADAESKIVSPITSVLTYMVSQGDLLEEAEARLLEALGLNPDLDLRTYDPYAVIENDLNNSVAADVLLSNLRIANIINIPEAILNIEGGTSYRSGQISQALFIQIAQNLRQTTGPADLQAIVGQVLPSAINSLALTVIVREEEISAMTEIIGKADPQSLQSNQYSVRETLIGSQMWVKDNIFDKIAEEFSVDIVELDDKLDPISVVDVENIVSEKNLARRSNLYSPSGKDFKTFFSSSSANKDCLWELETFDADGDTIYHSLLAGNFDFDGDGQNALVLEPDGRLCLLDYDDIRQLAGTTLNLEIKLDDLRGGKSSIQGEISIRNLLALDSSELDDSWHHSDWFGSFYSVEGSWIYHHPIGWLYVHPDEQGGFWFWDHKWDFWWWSKKQAFPWIYRDDSTQWDYLMVMPDGVNVFDLVNRRWRRRE